MLSVENKLPAFNSLMSKKTLYVYFCSGNLDLEQVTLILNKWPWLNVRKIKPSHKLWLFQPLCSKFDFLHSWPRTWLNDLSTQSWPRYGSTLLTYQKWGQLVNWFKRYQLERKNILVFWLPWPRYCSDLLTYQIWGQYVNLFKSYCPETQTDTHTDRRTDGWRDRHV